MTNETFVRTDDDDRTKRTFLFKLTVKGIRDVLNKRERYPQSAWTWTITLTWDNGTQFVTGCDSMDDIGQTIQEASMAASKANSDATIHSITIV